MKTYSAGDLIKIEIDEATASIRFYFRERDSISVMDFDKKSYKSLTKQEVKDFVMKK